MFTNRLLLKGRPADRMFGMALIAAATRAGDSAQGLFDTACESPPHFRARFGSTSQAGNTTRSFRLDGDQVAEEFLMYSVSSATFKKHEGLRSTRKKSSSFMNELVHRLDPIGLAMYISEFDYCLHR